jgi:adenylyl-sulfate kinase
METRVDVSHRGFTLWLTGLSGSGKSTIAGIIAERLRAHNAKVELLDGDLVRETLSKGLGFSKADRDENVRRIGFVCGLLSRNGVIVIVAAIAPYRTVRDEIRSRIPNFVEVYMDCPLEILIARDAKGLYKRALRGEIADFTGVSAPYEAPLTPELVLNSSQESPECSASRVWTLLQSLDLISVVANPEP